MNYDPINEDSEYDEISFFTIHDLIKLAESYPKHKFRFVGRSKYTVGELMSWRGSYCLPSISYQEGDLKTGAMIAEELKIALDSWHMGYKGGEYRFFAHDEFYVSAYSRMQEYKVVGHEVVSDEVVLLTKFDPY